MRGDRRLPIPATGSVFVATVPLVAALPGAAFAAVVAFVAVAAAVLANRGPLRASMRVAAKLAVPLPSVVPVLPVVPVVPVVVPVSLAVSAMVPAPEIATRVVARAGVVDLSVDPDRRGEDRVSERCHAVRDDAAQLVLEAVLELVARVGRRCCSEQRAKSQCESRPEQGCARCVPVMGGKRSRHGWFSPSASCALGI